MFLMSLLAGEVCAGGGSDFKLLGLGGARAGGEAEWGGETGGLRGDIPPPPFPTPPPPRALKALAMPAWWEVRPPGAGYGE